MAQCWGLHTSIRLVPRSVQKTIQPSQLNQNNAAHILPLSVRDPFVFHFLVHGPNLP